MNPLGCSHVLSCPTPSTERLGYWCGSQPYTLTGLGGSSTVGADAVPWCVAECSSVQVSDGVPSAGVG